MIHMRRGAVLLVGIAAVAMMGVFTDEGAGFGKPKGVPPQPVGPGTSSGFSSVKIVEDSAQRKYIQVGRDCIADQDWDQAIKALQHVLDGDKDYYVQVRDANDIARWTSVKFEANNLIGRMPVGGLQAYELKHGADAKTKLDLAKKKGDREMLADIAQRYCHTRAGIEANEILATLFLHRGQVFTAALRFEKLLQMNPDHTKLSDVTLFKASMAFYRAGDTKNYEATWERLTKNIKDQGGLKVGADLVPIAKLDAAVRENIDLGIVNVHDWPSWRGNVRNSAQANGSPPLLDTKIWSRPIFMDKLDGFNDEDPDQAAKDRVEKSIKQAEAANHAVLPGFFPIASQGIMVYRSQRDIRAVALKDIEARDEESGAVSKIKTGQIVWKSIPMSRSLAVLLEKNNTRVKVEQWMQSYDQIPGFNALLYDNSLIGTLVTDQRYVYAINDLAVPPHPGVFLQQQFNPGMNQYNPGDMKPLMVQNELVAYDLVNGKMKWDLNEQDAMFRDSHFISLPISIGGKLYVLNEKLAETSNTGVGNPFGGGWINPFPGDSELRLVCIDPSKLVQTATSPKPTIVGEPQTLGHIMQHNRMLQDIGRRVNAVQLAYDEGVLVCPTNAGEVFGIDLMTRSLVWSYPYRETAHQQIFLPGQVNPGFPQPPRPAGATTIYQNWKSSPPAIQDGKIVFTAPDADSVHCISLRDGKPVWKQKQQKGDLFMAGVYNGRVVVVSETNVRMYDLQNGSLLRTVYTGDLPSGQGVASKGMYYLPLKKGEILAIDIVKGEIKAHNRAPAGASAPGNLVFYDNMVLSQTPTEVAAYPQLVARLDAVRLDVKNDPQNLTKLTDFGELLLKNGEVQPAVDALLKAYQQNPPEPLGKRVKDRLFEALTDLMQIDFNKADKDHLTVYKALCSVPENNAEEQSRKAKYFRLVGQGREAQNNLVEAFQMYKEFGALPMHRQDGIASPEDPNHKIPVNVWLRGRISGMLAKAPPNAKEALETTIAAEWKLVEEQKNPDAIRSFVGMFDIPVRVGREARVRLAETIMERNERGNFLEAEMVLNQVMGSEYRAEAQTGGRALAALAQLEEMKGTMDSLRLAASYYRELNREFPDKAVRGKKTGAELFSDMATDKRYLMFLEQSSNPFGNAKLAARPLGAGAFNVGITGFVMMPEGDNTPFAKQNRLMLDPSNTLNPKISLRDTVTNQDRWTTNLGQVQMNQQLFMHLYQQANVNQQYYPNARFRFYQVKGHLVVCQVGIMVYCLDGDTGKKLWELKTVEDIPQNGINHLQQVVNDIEGNPEFMYWNQLTNQRFKVSLGRIGTAQASYVAIIGHKGLSVHDPLTGKVMWKRPDVSINSHLFGDEQYLFLAEANANGGFGAGRTIRATDGEVLQTQDFSNVYAMRAHTLGRQILAAMPGGGVRLYDILSGKDVWNKAFPQGSHILRSEDRNIVGVIEPNGKLTVLDVLDKGKELVTSNLVQGRITAEDVRNLRDPLLLQDADRFYVALNKPIEAGKVGGGLLHNNFNNGTRCLNVNGWFLAVHRHDTKKAKKGDLAWHSYMPITQQMIVLDQFDQSPIVLFTVRYNEIMPNGGNRWVSVTQSLHKATGKMIYDSGPVGINGVSPMFTAFQMDLKARLVNLIGFRTSVQHYVDDGKGPPPNPQGALSNPGAPAFAGIQPGIIGQPMAPPVIRAPAVRLRVVDPNEVQVLPLPELPPEKKR